MPSHSPLVEPRADVAAALTPAPEPEAPETEIELPDTLLQMPVFQGLFAGQPPAVSIKFAEFGQLPESATISKNKDGLIAAGINFYSNLAGDAGVLFNSRFISGEEIKAADASGELAGIAPPFAEVSQQIAASGEANPVLQAPAEAMPPATVQPAMPAPPAGVQKKVATARLKAAQPGAPSSGPRPGAGRLLASILKQPV